MVIDSYVNGKNNQKSLNFQLAQAAGLGDNEAVVKLLGLGADINSTHTDNVTPIYAAASSGHLETVALLIKEGADVNIPLHTGETALMISAHNCFLEIVQNILATGKANIEAKVGRYTAIYFAIKANCPKVVEQLLAVNAAIDSDEVGYSSLTSEGFYYHYEPLLMVNFLYEKNKNKYNQTYQLVMNHYWNSLPAKQQEFANNFPDNGKTFEVVIVRYNEDLSWVAKEFPNEKVTIYNKGNEYLGDLPTKANVIKIDNIGYLGGTYLYHIVHNYDQLADRTLFLQGQPYDVDTFRPLIRHKRDLPSTCKNIIGKCIEVKLKDEAYHLAHANWKGSPYEHFAKENSSMFGYTHKYIGNFLDDTTLYTIYGAEFAVDKDKILCRSLEHFQAMLKEFNTRYPMADHYQERLWDHLFGACINKLNSLLFEAAKLGNDEEIIKLLGLGADINSTDIKNTTPIYVAALYNQSKTVALLADKGADINIPLDTGETALIVSSHYCLPEVVRNILAAGKANIEAKALQHYTAIFFAIASNCPKIVEQLLAVNAIIYSDEISYGPRHSLFTAAFFYDLEKEKYNQTYQLVMNHYWKSLPTQQQEFANNFVHNGRTFEVVIARYNEDLSWVAKEFPNEKVTIYNKGEDDLSELPPNCKVIKLANLGREGYAYLEHIINNYEQLSDRIFFLQGHPYDIEAFLPFVRYKGEPNSICKNIIAKCKNVKLEDESNFLDSPALHAGKYKDIALSNVNLIEYTHKYIGNYSADTILQVVYGAEFAVNKENILCHDIGYFKAVIDTLKKKHPIEIHFMERLWDLFFRCPQKSTVNVEQDGQISLLNQKINEIKAYDKIYVINLERSVARKKAMVKQLDEAGVEYEIFNATDGYKVKIKNLKQEFFGSDIKNGSAKIEKSVTYKITCNPDDESPIEFNYLGSLNHLGKGMSAGELGIWCSHKMIWADAKEKAYKKIVVLEDDTPLRDNFKYGLNNFITNLPKTFDIGYIDLYQVKGHQYPLINNKYVNGFSNDSTGCGIWAIVLSDKAITTLANVEYYFFPIDIFFWCLTTGISIDKITYDHGTEQCKSYTGTLEVYSSSISLTDMDIHTAGRVEDSFIAEMGRM